MTKWNLKPTKKTSGGTIARHGKKIRKQRSRDYVPAYVAKAKLRKTRMRGGKMKTYVLGAEIANISVGSEIKKAKILSVKENTADSQFVRRNIITKGAIIETDIGKARVTSRPGQDGVINAVLVDEKKKD